MQPYSREYWKSLLPVIQAFVDGKDVEWIGPKGGIHIVSAPVFSDTGEWRIKPEEPFRLSTYEEAAELLLAKAKGQRLEFRSECLPSWEDSGNEWPEFDICQYRIKGESKLSLLAALVECADDLEAEIKARADGELPRRIERDMGTVYRARAAIAKAKGETP